MYRISDDRFTGISGRNFKMFRKLCGESTLKNVVLVTNMWGKVEEDVGEAREKELAEVYFKIALEKDAQLARHYHTTNSAHEIIRRIMKNEPTSLLIQRELVDERKDIKYTSAGKAVSEELNELMRRHEAEMNALREEMRLAIEEKDEWMKKVLEEETRKIKTQMDKMRVDSETMAAKYDQERKKMEKAMELMKDQARLDREAAHKKHLKEIFDLKTELDKNTNASTDERNVMLQRIHDLECRAPPPPRGGGGGGRCIITAPGLYVSFSPCNPLPARSPVNTASRRSRSAACKFVVWETFITTWYTTTLNSQSIKTIQNDTPLSYLAIP